MTLIDIDQFEQAGYSIVPGLLCAQEVAELVQVIEQCRRNYSKLRGGVRDIMDAVPTLRAISEHPKVRTLVDQVLGSDALVVRSTLFDKTPESNWKVPWHQDLTIAVEERRDVDSYGP